MVCLLVIGAVVFVPMPGTAGVVFTVASVVLVLGLLAPSVHAELSFNHHVHTDGTVAVPSPIFGRENLQAALSAAQELDQHGEDELWERIRSLSIPSTSSR